MCALFVLVPRKNGAFSCVPFRRFSLNQWKNQFFDCFDKKLQFLRYFQRKTFHKVFQRQHFQKNLTGIDITSVFVEKRQIQCCVVQKTLVRWENNVLDIQVCLCVCVITCIQQAAPLPDS